MNHSKVAIIGAGPAGIACAVQLKRYGIESLLFEKNQTGGLLRNANLVENYLGFEAGISGQDLVEKFRKNFDDLNIKPIFSEVKKVSFTDGVFHLETDNDLFTSEILVVASGTKPKKLEVIDSYASLRMTTNNKIFYEIVDLGKNKYSGKKFVIIGAGDAAFDYALNLVNNYNVSEVIILNRNNKAKCLPLLEKRTEETGKIKHIKNIKVENIEETDGKVLLSCLGQEDSINISADYIMPAIGRDSCIDFLDEELSKEPLSLQKEGLLYFIGDVASGNYRQTSIAAGDGIKTAMKIYNNY